MKQLKDENNNWIINELNKIFFIQHLLFFLQIK